MSEHIDGATFTAILQIAIMVWLAVATRRWNQRERNDAEAQKVRGLELDNRLGELKADLTAEIRASSDEIFKHLRHTYVTHPELDVLHKQVDGVPERLARLEGRDEQKSNN